MCNSVKSRTKSPLRLKTGSLLVVPLAAYLQVCEAQPSSQWTFASAEEASRALFVAVEGRDNSTLKQILGQNDNLMSSSDAAQDDLDRDRFVRKYQQMHRLVRAANGETVLYIGAENWPFPIPLVSRNGAWRYDSDAGEKEVLYRRIGENEVTAIEACQALGVTLRKPNVQGDANNQADTLLIAARSLRKPVESHGYSYRILSKPGNNELGFVAYPVVYGSSGVMTFIVNDAGVVYQKDLGTGTEAIVTKMAAYRADSTWTPVE